MDQGTPEFTSEMSIKLPKKKDDTTIQPAKVFDNYKEPASAGRQKAAYKKVANKKPQKKKKTGISGPPAV